MTIYFELLTGIGGEAIMMVGALYMWFLMAGRSTDPTMRTMMYIQVLLMIMADGWIVYFSFDSTIDQIWLWSWMMSIMFFTWLFIYAGLWITGNLTKGEIDNGF